MPTEDFTDVALASEDTDGHDDHDNYDDHDDQTIRGSHFSLVEIWLWRLKKIDVIHWEGPPKKKIRGPP